MKRKQSVLTVVALILVASMLLPFAACATVEVTSVELDRSTLILDIGETATLSVFVFPEKATNTMAKWVSSDQRVATVDKDGNVKAMGEGSAIIKVTVGGKSTTCSVTVNDPEKRAVAVTGVSLDIKVLNLDNDNPVGTLVATVMPENATDKSVTWTSSDETVAKVQNGVVSAVGAGQAIITVVTNNNHQDTCAVFVTGEFGSDDPDQKDVIGVSLNKTIVDLTVGATEQLVALVKPDSAENKNVIWASSNPSVASVSDGLITALSVGAATITVTTEEGEFTAQCDVTVSERVVGVTGISLDKNNIDLSVGSRGQLCVDVLPADATNREVVWSSSDESVAKVIDEGNGIILAAGEGTATITVTSIVNPQASASCVVTVSAKQGGGVAVTGITLNQSSLALTVGSQQTLSATVQPSNAADQTLLWLSSDTSIATVRDGIVTAISAGTAVITVETADGGYTATCTVAVHNIKVSGVVLNKTELSIAAGGKQQLTAIVSPVDAFDKSVVWSSSNAQVATVDSVGNVTAVGAGTAIITVTTTDGGFTAQCTVTVSAGSPTSVSINKKTLTFSDIGATQQLTATVRPTAAANKDVIWSSSDESVAVVDGNGLVKSVGEGSATITVTTVDGGLTATCEVTVKISSSDIYVQNVSSLSTRTVDFIMGMDASAVPSLEAAGVTYKNFAGEVEDVFKILKDNGITDIRIRVWNDPYDSQGRSYGGGNCDVDNAIEIAKRCEKVGLGVIVDFHYSDFWADPGKQTLPKAWRNYTTSQVAQAIYDFTYDSLIKIKATGVKITMVQVGNETTSGIAGTTGWASNTATICNYINQGSKAVRAATGTVASGGARVAVHFTNPESGGYLNFAQYLDSNKVDYDVFGSSYYPYWHGTLENLSNQLKSIHTKYNKEVMVLETSYAFTYEDADGNGNTALTTTNRPVTVQGQSNSVRAVIETIASLGDYGLGVCYWEGTWVAASTSTSGEANRKLCKQYGCGWATSYASGYDSSANDGGCVVDNQAFFLSDGTPLESLKVFKLAKGGNTISIKADVYENQEDYYTVGVGTISLPTTVTVTLNNDSTVDVAVTWLVNQAELESYLRTVGTYTIKGTTIYGGECYFYAWVQNKNLLVGGSFESDEEVTGYASTDNFIQTTGLGEWKLNYTKATSALQLYVSNESQNARMGTQSFHFWDNGTVNFTLSQMVDLSKLSEYGSGKFGCSFDIQGDDGANVDIHSYIKVTYTNGQTKEYTGSKVGFNGWQNWSRTAVSGADIDLNSVASIEVGISVYAELSGNGPWGNIDNCQFYFEG